MLPEKKAAPEAAAATVPGSARGVRSYVLRSGRLTVAQQRALDTLWPRFGIAAGAEQLDFAQLFGNDHPVVLEIGFGDGEATWRMALAEPETNVIGVEVHRPGIGHLLLMLEQHEVSNVRIASADAVEFIATRVPGRSLAGVRLFFPDPWPKKRHGKRRIVQPCFVALLAAALQAGARLHIATDWAPYAAHVGEVMAGNEDFGRLTLAAQGQRPFARPETRFERRGERLGHEVFDLVFTRRA